MNEMTYLEHLQGRFKSLLDEYVKGDKSNVLEMRRTLKKLMGLK
jgi:hypothetical protein